MMPSLLRHVDACILVYDATDPNSIVSRDHRQKDGLRPPRDATTLQLPTSAFPLPYFYNAVMQQVTESDRGPAVFLIGNKTDINVSDEVRGAVAQAANLFRKSVSARVPFTSHCGTVSTHESQDVTFRDILASIASATQQTPPRCPQSMIVPHFQRQGSWSKCCV
mmetsp:Transcript_25827/g.67794  ORF Transcript_25827/g.67794 Transcript_25827/m.67794 type:complete len:165 (-) Transcript_25827:97-591(-)